MSKVPTHSVEIGLLKVAVWKNQHEVDGEPRTFENIKLQRSYKDKDDVWQTSTIYLNSRDVGNAIALLQNVQQQVLVKKVEAGVG